MAVQRCAVTDSESSSESVVSRALPQQVGPPPCEVCRKSATHHSAPPSLMPLCEECVTVTSPWLAVWAVILGGLAPSSLLRVLIGAWFVGFVLITLWVLRGTALDSTKAPA